MERELILLVGAAWVVLSALAIRATRVAAQDAACARRQPLVLLVAGILLALLSCFLSDGVVRPFLELLAGPPERSDYLTASEFLHRVGGVTLALAIVLSAAGVAVSRGARLHPADVHWIANPVSILVGCVVAAYVSPLVMPGRSEYRYWSVSEWVIVVFCAPAALAGLLWWSTRVAGRGRAHGPRAA
jgi:Na+-driven multidrug efflux pump